MSVFIDGFEIDVAVNIDPVDTSQVTVHPIEEGADAADHIIQRPRTLSMTGWVSDTPFGTLQVSRGEGSTPASDAYDTLTRIQQSKKLVTIETDAFPLFTNMAITSLHAPKSAETGEALEFRATFQQISFKDVAIANKVTLVDLPRQRKKKRKGHTTAPKVEVKTPDIFAKEDNRGTLKKLVDIF